VSTPRPEISSCPKSVRNSLEIVGELFFEEREGTSFSLETEVFCVKVSTPILKSVGRF
jgi:hypothetical protein